VQVHLPRRYTPALSEVLTAIEKVGLWVTDMEVRGCITPRPCATGASALANRERTGQLAATTIASSMGVLPRGLRDLFPVQRTRWSSSSSSPRSRTSPLTRDHMLDAEKGIKVTRSMAAE
jgi:cyclopropane-fatty-acyl-phospholipid synthase